ncbi:MAG: right-handed parallel beta-helix repeat-containing protein [Prolixibacteraceae bacterium]|nr:right-handed parallel beta-helix repeat-containing protein [Prolixibacteraceae bacterium]
MKNCNVLAYSVLTVMFLFLYTNVDAKKIPAGNVSGTWTKKSSPYIIKGEITIPDGETLSIEPGVEVIFEGHYKFNVQGRLLAIGAEKDTITFTSKDKETGWHGIRFENTPASNDSSKIIYCKLEYGKANSGIQVKDRWGGAICVTTGKLKISHCLFRNNMSYHPSIDQSGGGAIFSSGSPVIEYCEFCYNESTFGSALLIFNSNISPLIRNNYFHHNNGHGTINIGSWGGNKTSPILTNNIIANNHSNGHGIIHFSNGGGQTVFINNTIVNNTCDGDGGAIFTNFQTANPLFVNTIIYGNKPAQVRLEIASELHFFNCLIEGGKDKFSGQSFSGTYQNIIDDDPLFSDEANFDFHLKVGSPCVGRGVDSVEVGEIWYYAPKIDFEGNPRPNPSNSKPDIGAVESSL